MAGKEKRLKERKGNKQRTGIVGALSYDSTPGCDAVTHATNSASFKKIESSEVELFEIEARLKLWCQYYDEEVINIL